MRSLRSLSFNICVALSMAGALAVPFHAHAQMGGGHGGGGQDQQDADDAKKKKRDLEFGKLVAPLPQLKNAGPCPYVKVLYDAARYVELKDNVAAAADVGYTGEISNISAMCLYKSDQPIRVRAQILFQLGRGPQAKGRTKVYHYWVAVTDRNNAVLGKSEFTLPVTFPAGEDRVNKVEAFDNIVIPRKDTKVSGANFEVLVGFDVTPEMADFNRAGKRFRANAGQAPEVAAVQP
jgi:hypothetical protein